jgi:GNAT superfamily N-acetyltransferase
LTEKLQKVPLFRTCQLNKELIDFPVAKELCCSQIVVFHTVAGCVVAACGIRRNLFNVLVLHVRDGYQGKRIGTQILQKTIAKAYACGLSFITLSVSSNNTIASHLYFKSGFKKVVHLQITNLDLMILPLKRQGRILFLLLRALFLITPTIFLSFVHNWYYRKTLPKYS